MSSFGATVVVTPAGPAGAAPPAGPRAGRRPPFARPAAPEPDFGPHVRVFGPGTPAAAVQDAFDAAAGRQDAAGPGSAPGDRQAFLFKPGTYRVDAELGPHTSVSGLGLAPGDVTIHGALRVAGRAHTDAAGGVPAGLRRAAERLNVVAARGGSANGPDDAGPGQGSSGEGSSGQGGPAQGSSSGGAESTGPVSTGPEKPFLYADDAGAYRVFLPALRHGRTGTVWGRAAHGWSVPIERFFVARPADSVRCLNRALAQGRHLLLTPGVYRLTDTVRVKWAGTVVLGLGFVTLTPVGGTVPMTVGDARGLRIAGLMFDAGPATPPVLLEVGRDGGRRCDAREPASVQDVFFRMGAAEDARALVVHSDHVLLDGVWAWRAGQAAGADAHGYGPLPGVPERPGARFHDLSAVLPAGRAGDHVAGGGGSAVQGAAAVPR